MLLGDIILVRWEHRPGLGNQSEVFCLVEKKRKEIKSVIFVYSAKSTILSEPGETEEKENWEKEIILISKILPFKKLFPRHRHVQICIHTEYPLVDTSDLLFL